MSKQAHFADLDPHGVLQALGLVDATTVIPIRGGSDNAIWRIETADKVYALRVFQRGKHEACQQEGELMQGVLAAGLPVPEVHAVGGWHDYPALLLSWLPGRTIAEELQAQPSQARHLGTIFGRMHAMIHTLPVPDFLSAKPNYWIGWPKLDEEIPLQKLLQARSNPPADVLLHLDYHPFNVLTDGKSITGILDWRNALAGDPRADAARTVSILSINLPSLLIMEAVVLSEMAEGWQIGYEGVAGALGDMSLFYAWAGAVMKQDLAAKCGPEELATIHDWTIKWKEQAGCP